MNQMKQLPHTHTPLHTPPLHPPCPIWLWHYAGQGNLPTPTSWRFLKVPKVFHATKSCTAICVSKLAEANVAVISSASDRLQWGAASAGDYRYELSTKGSPSPTPSPPISVKDTSPASMCAHSSATAYATVEERESERERISFETTRL